MESKQDQLKANEKDCKLGKINIGNKKKNDLI